MALQFSHSPQGSCPSAGLPVQFKAFARIRAVVVNNCCHQMFGGFSGRAVLDDGTVLQIDDLQAFAEHAVNNW